MNGRGFATDPAPGHFTGEDVIGDEVYGRAIQKAASRIPASLRNKLNQQWEDPQQEEYQSETQDLQLSYNLPQPEVKKEVNENTSKIVKEVVVNIVVNLKINAV